MVWEGKRLQTNNDPLQIHTPCRIYYTDTLEVLQRNIPQDEVFPEITTTGSAQGAKPLASER